MLAVLEHTLKLAPQEHKPPVLNKLALLYEQERNFELANNCYLEGKPHLAPEHEKFTKRMVKRL